MPKQNFILRRKTDDISIEMKLQEFLKSVKATVIDKGSKSILVNSSVDLVTVLPSNLKEDWMVIPEKKYQIPDTRKTIIKEALKPGIKAKAKAKTTTKTKPKVSKKKS